MARDTKKTGKHDSLIITAIGLLPLVIYWITIEWVVSPPFWQFFHHWELTMYYTSVDLADGLPVHIASNPGTPVQLLGYLIVKLIGTEPQNYPEFLRWAHSLTLVLCLASGLLIQRIVSQGKNQGLSLACIWFYFSSVTALTYLNVWAAETLYLPMALLFIYSFIRMLETSRRLWVLAAGLALGGLISLKFNFIAWLPAFYIVILTNPRPYSELCRSLFMSTLGLVTAFLAITAPVRDQYEYMISLLFGWTFTDGISGPGTQAAITPRNVGENWFQFMTEFWPWLIIIVGALLLMLLYYRKSDARRLPPPVNKAILFFAVATLASLATVSRFYAARYMLPVGLAGLLLLVVIVRTLPKRLSTRFQITASALAFAMLVVAIHSAIQSTARHVQDIKSVHAGLQDKLDQLTAEMSTKQPLIIYGWPIPHPVAAMRHQPYYEQHQRALDELYPNTGTHVPWRDYVRVPPDSGEWRLAVIPMSQVQELKENSLPIINATDSTREVVLFENFTVIEQLHGFAILAPAD